MSERTDKILAKGEALKEAIKTFEAHAPSLTQAELVEIIATAKDGIVFEQLEREEFDEQYTLSLMAEGAWRKILTIAEDALNKSAGGA
jgi:hypothetical protein